ncbi:uncharacterized protein OCT59_025763 [Rhizophagus irregularis]|uniref:Bifunctional AAA family ATPase chaperone/translocase BCS1 n=2 Tax=Rhizophagus irregularis TaxID=588596 RepID=A0A015LEL9_RHIIW|nr:bifunctional AAA family ATPase chaperone/translocase BCS1 [Rhizophagus irregularis DAOM 197198w]UZO05413.1 hypothetical protein OCT59_025763 [Rhizophagus irregularis]GBC11060.1 mitochondrial chaperone BCS1 isoform X1 [Rhizophagus irregularis DAOM 181602=DAOM 197198]CAG8674474.1 9949_t:CDS:1 [Rhizophagus irregularis]
MIKNDSELSATFSAIPSNQLIVIEDVDAQSTVLHNRKFEINSIDKFVNAKYIDNNVQNFTSSDFSLSVFLACLDGHLISEGNIIIMTTNHIDFLDPACIRPGQIDVHFKLGYCTHYQLNKMFKNNINESGIPVNVLKNINENVLPPCEVMALMSLYQNEQEQVVIENLIKIANQYNNNHKNICKIENITIKDKKRKCSI